MEVIADAGRRELSFDGFRFPLPAEIDDASALALAHHGVTAWHLLRTCAHLRQGESVLVHDAAGGVGALAVQLAVSFGAGRVVATAPTQAQRRLAVRLGADIAVDSSAPGLTERLLAGGLVDVVVGLPANTSTHQTGPLPAGVLPSGTPLPGALATATFPTCPSPVDGALALLAPFGRLVCHGEPVDVDPVRLGSRAVVGFRLGDCLAKPEMVVAALSELIGLTSAGRLHPLASARTVR
ncbi:threonine dehydrogenase-like Zn-dependent dehydrogenase [Saccharothrix ecbatanensis]|uniref:Threonine dehydrogenase-like Zn-dependent dehydrogenase n=1 Tax=Saccharothrix ecbatanensis TaxID=1105145 RepID=A0A7W9HMN5_9PSEU|nr:zinc-binding dehydrogenase [Saccharothrix ecbatanensis]MBB5804713.1 threonine dehydrogenase-like Zn-dependent dehydrogenase [Saccharothrix ecbatanensis]